MDRRIKKLPAYAYLNYGMGEYYSLYFIFMRNHSGDPLYDGFYIYDDRKTIRVDYSYDIRMPPDERVTYFGRLPEHIQKEMVKAIKEFINTTDNFAAGVMAKKELDRIRRKWPWAIT